MNMHDLIENDAQMANMCRYYAEHDALPDYWTMYVHLPVLLLNPEDNTYRVVRIGDMTPEDIEQWGDNHESLPTKEN